MQNWFSTKLDDILKQLDISADIDMMEADLTILVNKWDEAPDGGNYKIYFGGQPGKDASARQSNIDTDRG